MELKPIKLAPCAGLSAEGRALLAYMAASDMAVPVAPVPQGQYLRDARNAWPEGMAWTTDEARVAAVLTELTGAASLNASPMFIRLTDLGAERGAFLAGRVAGLTSFAAAEDEDAVDEDEDEDAEVGA
jgi:hypothetical protein